MTLIFFNVSCATENRQQLNSNSKELDLESLTPHQIYGELLDDVQMARIFPDGKTFVDMVPNKDPQEIVTIYKSQNIKEGFVMEEFVHQNFELPPKESFRVEMDQSATVEAHITKLWDQLEREADGEQKGSRIRLDYPYVVPGGRFTEIYYWDSYFTMLGLAESGRVDLIEGMVKNFANLINEFGFIPNGSRTYYLGRSQPPFFSLMVDLLASMEGDTVMVKYLPAMLKEHKFWMRNAENLSPTKAAQDRVVLLDGKHVLNRYWDDFEGPRDESYFEDVLVSKNAASPKAEMFKHLRAGAESGWDFSSRWFKDGQDIHTIETTDIIPVDLNALLYQLELNISRAGELSGDKSLANSFKVKAQLRKKAMLQYFWNEDDHFLMDFNFKTKQQSRRLSLAAVYPLCFKIVPQKVADEVVKKIAKDFLKEGGVVSTLQTTAHQWYPPNGWAPLQWMTVWGLKNYGHDSLANEISKRWLHLNEAVFQRTGKMMEKYNVEDLSLEAGGGEYPLQDGFGWTNGVYLKLKHLDNNSN
ncbi:alpha,alpha-trehalase TreF [Cytophagales bacterium RKSG123]|nr:alpha,alpha-trehalase TreF [Xanthovirga aplysinae]